MAYVYSREQALSTSALNPTKSTSRTKFGSDTIDTVTTKKRISGKRRQEIQEKESLVTAAEEQGASEDVIHAIQQDQYKIDTKTGEFVVTYTAEQKSALKQAPSSRDAPATQSTKTLKEKEFEMTPIERQRTSISYTGEDRIIVEKGETVEQAVKRSRATSLVSRTQTKQTLQIFGRPEGYTYPISMLPEKLKFKGTVTTAVESKPKLAAGYEERIEKLVEREKGIESYRQERLEKLGLKKTPAEEKFVLIGSQEAMIASSRGLKKTIGAIPLNIGTGIYALGGRISFAAESLFHKEGRKELGSAVKRVPAALGKMYNPTRTEGLINIALTGITIKGVAQARVAHRQKLQYTKEKSVTHRITTDKRVVDRTDIRVEAMYGKQKLAFKGTGKQTFYKVKGVKGKLYRIKGEGKLVQVAGKGKGAVIDLKSKGLSIQQKGGVDVLKVTKVYKKGKLIDTQVSKVKTAELIKEPAQYYISHERTGQIPKGGTLKDFKQTGVGAGRTAEIYIRDLFGKGKSSLRKYVKSETGKTIGVEQVLASKSGKLGQTAFSKAYKITPRQIDMSRTAVARKAFDSVYYNKPIPQSSSVSYYGNLLLKQRIEGIVAQRAGIKPLTLPTQEAALVQVAKTQAAQQISALQTAKTATATTSGIGVTSMFPTTQESIYRSPETQQVDVKPIIPRPSIKLDYKTDVKVGQVQDVKPMPPKIVTLPELRKKPDSSQKTITKPVVTIITQPAQDTTTIVTPVPQQITPVVRSEVVQRTQPITQPIVRPVLKPLFTPSLVTSFAPPTAFPLILSLPPFIKIEPHKGKSKIKKSDAKTRYKPSILGIEQNIKVTRHTKLTGFEIRGIPKKSKKKKLKDLMNFGLGGFKL